MGEFASSSPTVHPTASPNLAAPMGAPSMVATVLTATAMVVAMVVATAWEDTDTHLTLMTSPPADTNWASGEDDHVVARAEYDFTAASQEELSVQAGEMLNLAPKELQPRVRGWLLASVDGETTGLVPANYVKILGKRRGRRAADMERLAQAQQANTQAPQTSLAAQMQTTGAQGFTPDPASASASSEDLLESAYRETPASFNQGSSTSTMFSNTPLNIPEKTDP